MNVDVYDEYKCDSSVDEYGEHIRQNNKRLATLAQCITKTVTFTSACNELHNWCKDARAFSSYFEHNLLEALQAAFSICTHDGFDLQLVSELINTCFHSRRSLSKEGSVRVSRWYEQLRRKRASKAAKLKRKEEKERRLMEESNRINSNLSLPPSPSLLDSFHPSEEGFHPSFSMWNQTSLSTGAGPSTPSPAVPLQSPAFANQFGHMSPSYNQSRMMMSAGPSTAMPQAGMYAPMMSSFPTGMVQGGMMMQSTSVPPVAATTKKQSAAQQAQAAAAAAQHQLQMAHMQQMQQRQSMMPLPPNIQPMGRPVQAMYNDGKTMIFVFVNGFIGPHHPLYPSLLQQWHIHQQKVAEMHRQQSMTVGGGGSTATPSPHFGQQPAMNPQGVPIATQTAPGQNRPLNGYGVPTPTMPTGGMMQPMMTPGASHPMSLPSPNMTSTQGMPQVQRVGTPVAFGQLQQMGMQGQQPMQQHAVVCVPNPMMTEKTVIHIVEQLIQPFIEMIHDEKLRKTPFTISAETMNRLINDSSLEVHIRSWARDDKSFKIVWHSNNNIPNCEIVLNGETMPIRNGSLPILVDKKTVREGANELEIIEKSCVCLAVFGMAIVERLTLDKAIERVFSLPSNSEQGKDVERNKAKMREFISRESSTGTIRLPLFCQRTRQPITIPARSTSCAHTACFDVKTTLSISVPESGYYECPICKVPFSLDDIEIDHFVGSILKESYQKRALEVMLDQSCSWQVIPREESNARFASLQPHPAYATPYAMQPMQPLQQMQQMQSMGMPSSFPMGMPLQQLQPTQMNGGRKRESSDTGGTALKRFKSESFVAGTSGRSPAPQMMAPQSVAPSMMMMGGPATPMGSGMYGGGPPSVPAMHAHSIPNMASPFTGVVHPSPMKDPSSHHSVLAASPMGSTMAPSTPYGSNTMGGTMNGTMNQTALTCATDGTTHVQPTSSAPYTPGSVDNRSNGMTMVTASGAGPLSNPQMRAPSAALTPDTQASTSNASAEDDGTMRDSLSNIEGLYLSRELNIQDYLYIVGSIEVAKITEDFACYNFDTPPSSHSSIAPQQSNEWTDALSVCGVQSSA